MMNSKSGRGMGNGVNWNKTSHWSLFSLDRIRQNKTAKKRQSAGGGKKGLFNLVRSLFKK